MCVCVCVGDTDYENLSNPSLIHDYSLFQSVHSQSSTPGTFPASQVPVGQPYQHAEYCQQCIQQHKWKTSICSSAIILSLQPAAWVFTMRTEKQLGASSVSTEEGEAAGSQQRLHGGGRGSWEPAVSPRRRERQLRANSVSTEEGEAAGSQQRLHGGAARHRPG